jgi:hypothetical protein
VLNPSTTTPVATAERDRERVYPMVRKSNDSRFTFGLMFEVVSVLERHGYPRPADMDYVDLQHDLFACLYGPTTPLVES